MGEAGQILKTSDDGATWSDMPLVAAAVTPSGTVWAFEGKAILKSTDLGETSSACSGCRQRHAAATSNN